ncbi:type I secretion system permease/ATPase [Vibrio vulnificus]|uniref:peptidase domain-containing ABC transporter n=1 Tax=Vibrio vulnificus TaxID=672 RepID=UPI0002E7656D|nr:type I secretion system permease/ATPase [Vibrio vulnificus]ASM95434.1 peptidase C39 [Vibrio vulnificus NBRC 15645 = ATCC 27562]MDK2701989.1 type I secretion system permease/ATPase [Vibrio vulnificus]OJI41039.1 Toxin RTX-I translocation ATP-binding protein [Vibrio vulnificus]SUP55849.1 peptidase C39 [Vibrio vulnificus]
MVRAYPKRVALSRSAVVSSQVLLKLTGVSYQVPKEHTGDDLKSWLKNASGQTDGQLRLKRLKEKKLAASHLPLAYQQHDGEFVVLARLSDEQALIQRHHEHVPQVISRTTLQEVWAGQVIQYHESGRQFDIRWFIPEFLRYKKLLSSVLFFSFLLQLLALISPLFFQVVMDKVLVHANISTLDVLAIVLVIVGVYEVLLKGLREYLFAHTTNRIDIQLGGKLFGHLLSLPLIYFKTRQVGSIVARVRELSSIRDFLTSSAMTLSVDVAFSVVFFAVMGWLSFPLMVMVVSTIPVYFILAWVTGAHLHKAVERQFSCGAKNTSFVTESVSGIQTMKSLAIEPAMRRKWQGQVEDFAHANFDTQKITAVTNQIVQLVQKLTAVLVIWAGAMQVMALEMTIGQLIAFNMLLSHVHQPLGKLVDLWQQFIQTRVGIDALGDMLNLPPETEHSSVQVDGVSGNIQLRNVVFSYQPKSPAVLKSIDLSIRAGETIGIVGPSGSGKSTITRLIQKLYLPVSGSIHIDGIDLATISSSSLRQHIGVVLQENYLFNKTVRENICLKKPTADLEEIIKAAKLAGAHDFILKLPMGYDTVLAEGGVSLSGGQRQRVAIARALLGDPKVLIFDEATSALDDESQEVIQNNMSAISQGRTVVIIAHRLSTVRSCDRIITVEAGQVTSQGSHEELVAQNGIYRRLWQLQQAKQQEERE